MFVYFLASCVEFSCIWGLIFPYLNPGKRLIWCQCSVHLQLQEFGHWRLLSFR